jgi:hypothetical protein
MFSLQGKDASKLAGKLAGNLIIKAAFIFLVCVYVIKKMGIGRGNVDL